MGLVGSLGRVLGLAGGIGAAVTAGAWLEARAFVLHEVRVPISDEGSPELRILHLSDMHLVPRQRLKRRFVSKLAGLAPDLVITTGDNIGSAAAIPVVLEAMSGLLARPGAFVFGSNDYFEPRFRNPVSYLFGASKAPSKPVAMPWQMLSQAFQDAGWVDLNNRAGVIEVAGLRIELRGTDDAHHDRDDYAAVAGPVGADADLAFGVTHAPYRRVLDAMTDDGVRLIFAGHTHGGQICLPTYRAIINNCDLPLEHTSGLHTWTSRDRQAFLHVDAGVGTSPKIPLRLFCRPGATMLRLVPRIGTPSTATIS